MSENFDSVKIVKQTDEEIRILIVDDEEIMRDLLTEVINDSLGYNVELASSAEEGLAKYREGYHQILVLDIRLSGKMTGMDLLKKMQKALPLQKIGETLDYSTTTLQVHIRILIEQNMIAIDNEPTQTLKKEFYVITKKGDDFLQRIERFLSKQINTR